MANTIKGLLHNINGNNFEYMHYKMDKEEADIVKELLEKEIPSGYDSGHNGWICPKCKMSIQFNSIYCSGCGQKIL